MFRIRWDCDDPITEIDFFGEQPGVFPAEDECDGLLASRGQRKQVRRRVARMLPHELLGPPPGRTGNGEEYVGERFFERVEKLDLVEVLFGAVRDAVDAIGVEQRRLDQPEPV